MIAAVWLAALSDAYVEFDDLYSKLSGPVVVKNIDSSEYITVEAETPLPAQNHISLAVKNAQVGMLCRLSTGRSRKTRR